MIYITPSTEVRLTHRAWRVAVAESGHIAAISKEGFGTLLAPDHTTCVPIQVPADASGVTLSATGGLLAVAARGRLAVISTTTLRPVHRLNDSIEACCFRPNDILWTAARWDEDSIAIEVREPGAWKVVARTELKDPFRDSSFMMLPHPDPERVAIWAAAGQDGQCLFWARCDGSSIVADRFPGIEACPPPSFLASGKQFLAICDDNELRLYDFPLGPVQRRMPWPFDEMENQIGDTVSFVDSDRALLDSLADLLYLVDLRQMAIADEVCLRGHEPRPVAEVYPVLSEDRGRCSDLNWFGPLPAGGFVSVHTELPFRPDSHDSLLTWHVPSAKGSA